MAANVRVVPSTISRTAALTSGGCDHAMGMLLQRGRASRGRTRKNRPAQVRGRLTIDGGWDAAA
jgi:hypothetical protein